MTVRRLLSVLVTVIVVWAGNATIAQARDRLVIGINQFPSTLNPIIDSMLVKSFVLAMARRSVSSIGNDWESFCQLCTELATFESGRAEAFDLLDDDGKQTGKKGVRARFTLRDDIFWGDGVPVTTRDFVFTWHVGRHPETGVADLRSFQDITNIEVQDDKTFTIVSRKLDYRYYALNGFQLLPFHLEQKAFSVPREYRSRTLYETDPTNPGLYNGPYRITEVMPGSYIVLKRNAHWRGKRPTFDEIQVRTIEKTAALEANLLSGAIDYIAGEAGLSLDQALAFEKRHGAEYQIIHKPGLIYEHIDLMLDNPILADIRVRRALVHAIDRQAISDRLFAGKQPVAHGSVHPLDWIYDPDIPKYVYDPDRAKVLLDEAGWSVMNEGVRHNAAGQPLRLEIVTTAGNRVRELVEQVLQSYWKRVGIAVRIRNQPARVLFGETISKRKFTGLAMFAWLSAPESLPRTTLHSDSIPTKANNWAGQNYTGFKNAEMDRLIDAVEIELDREKRGALWGEIQRIYAEYLPAIPLYFRTDTFILPKWLKGVRPTGHFVTTTNWIEEWRVE
ncbi:MAG: peptide ABC transporter [Rhodospirillaceae bacterium]|nr:peptide ABC transporter [Rhodospirillaceae bacterium]